jgi:hypothetical protein
VTVAKGISEHKLDLVLVQEFRRGRGDNEPEGEYTLLKNGELEL